MADCSCRFGNWFTIRFPRGLNVVFTSSPEAAKDVFAGDPDKLFAGEGNAIFKPLLGQHSLLVLDGPTHRRARRLMMPPFHGDRMKAYGKTIGGIVTRHLALWPRSRSFRLHPAMQSVTMDVILTTVFGLSEGERLRRLREKLIELLDSNQSATDLFMSGLFLDADGNPPFAALMEAFGRRTRWGSFINLRREIDGILFAEISDRRKIDVHGREDVLSLLIAAKDQDGESLNDQELRDEMITLLVAGHETSATALSWIFYRLSTHPQVLKKLQEELAQASGEEHVNPEVIMGLPYLEAVINETLRLDPVASFVWRILKAPMRLGGRDLPAGTAIAPSIYLIHRSPSLWPDPESFDPDRFIRSHPAPWEFLPFGGGGRRCLGMAFATYEIKLIVASVLQSLSVKAVPGYMAKVIRRGVIFAPSDGMPVILATRPGISNTQSKADRKPSSISEIIRPSASRRPRLC